MELFLCLAAKHTVINDMIKLLKLVDVMEAHPFLLSLFFIKGIHLIDMLCICISEVNVLLVVQCFYYQEV